jgi:hypothetical protein
LVENISFIFYPLLVVYFVYNIYIAFVMEKKTVSFKLDKAYREALEKEASKKEWTLSYYIQSIAIQHVKRHKLLKP